ncbi:hypothetical protein [Pantoea eucalypti]|uniref:hypothetical protein n=1 Tax=Pantoea eucalypti TaxID=470933 RepID=UPI0009D087D2|nr:hypothetical protein [Pantoea eucalypti]SKA20068.1 hypothetical protein SAMN03097723_3560 [Pantoea eucalypti]
MITLYTVDRGGYFDSGNTPHLTELNGTGLTELDQYIQMLFPDGMSPHGHKYFFNSNSSVMKIDCSTELHLEMHRRAFHSHKPSRFTSLFACQAIEECIVFRQKYGSARNPIYSFEIDEKDVHFGDMELLKAGCSTLAFSYHLDLYWSGESFCKYEPSHTPFYEVLVNLSMSSITNWKRCG